jgi:hypothetical protein
LLQNKQKRRTIGIFKKACNPHKLKVFETPKHLAALLKINGGKGGIRTHGALPHH